MAFCKICLRLGKARSAHIVLINANPAKRSSSLTRLFPPGALAAELRVEGNPAALFPAEAKHLKRAVPKRAREFAAGRLCARLLLAEFGIHDFPIEVAADRQPVWPETLVGSITHTSGFCAAVVAERTRLAAVGLDSEISDSVKTELWPSICTLPEIDWLRTLPESRQARAATLIFSAKEAFYKCQYPLVGEALGFHAARVEVSAWGDLRGDFKIHATRRIGFAAQVDLPMHGQYLFHEQFVTAGIAVPASGLNQ